MPHSDYDVIIVGSGTVGATIACILLQGGMQVALIEKMPLTPIPIESLDLRVFALTRASERILTHLGLWEGVSRRRASPFRQMVVWDENSSGYIHFDSATLIEPTLGYIVEQSVLQAALLEKLTEFNNLTWYRPSTVQRLTFAPEKLTVHLDNGQSLTTRLVISAEGAQASIRTLAGIPYSLHDYGQHAIVANVTTERQHQETAWQRFLSSGPLAFLPLCDSQQCSIVWSADTPVAHRLMALEKTEFLPALTKAFAVKLGTVVDCGPRLIFPLQRRYVHQYVQPRLALIGDAAHTVHPLAGQGVNLGLLDVAALGEIILEAYHAHRDFGHYSVLRRYERERKGNNLAMLFLMDGFKHLFGTQLPFIQRARAFGLKLTNQNEVLKNLIMRQAMGLNDDLPKLARRC